MLMFQAFDYFSPRGEKWQDYKAEPLCRDCAHWRYAAKMLVRTACGTESFAAACRQQTVDLVDAEACCPSFQPSRAALCEAFDAAETARDLDLYLRREENYGYGA